MGQRKGLRIRFPNSENIVGGIGDDGDPGSPGHGRFWANDFSAQTLHKFDGLIYGIYLHVRKPPGKAGDGAKGDAATEGSVGSDAGVDAPVVDGFELLDLPAEEGAVEVRQGDGLVAINLKMSNQVGRSPSADNGPKKRERHTGRERRSSGRSDGYLDVGGCFTESKRKCQSLCQISTNIKVKISLNIRRPDCRDGCHFGDG